MRVARIWRCSKWLCEKNQITPTLQSVPNVSIISGKKTGIWGPPTYGNGKVREICRTFLCEEKKNSPRMKQSLPVTSGLFPCLWCSTHSKTPVKPTHFSIQECHAIDPPLWELWPNSYWIRWARLKEHFRQESLHQGKDPILAPFVPLWNLPSMPHFC